MSCILDPLVLPARDPDREQQRVKARAASRPANAASQGKGLTEEKIHIHQRRKLGQA